MKWIRIYFIPLLVLLVLVTSQCGIRNSVQSVFLTELAQANKTNANANSGQSCSVAREAKETKIAFVKNLRKQAIEEAVYSAFFIAHTATVLDVSKSNTRSQKYLYLLYKQLKLTDC